MRLFFERGARAFYDVGIKPNKIIILSFIFLIVGPLAYACATIATEEYCTVQVLNTGYILTTTGDKTSGQYMVYTLNESFCNTDSWVYLKFNSSDVQGQMQVGKRYVFKVVGFRIPFLSMYRNIVEARPL